MKKYIHVFLCAVFILFPFASTYASVSVDFTDESAAAWQTYKQLYIEGYKQYPAYGLVFDAASCNMSNDACDYAVSEGQGYGMLLAVIHNDQATFDKIFYAAEKWMWNGKAYDWKISTSGEKWGTNGATDADEDIAMALILADQKTQKGVWTANADYEKKAQVVINAIFDYMTVNGYLKPGDAWGGPDLLNLSYFAPTWYRFFYEYEKTEHDWQTVIDTQYTILLNTAKKYNGLIPDWQDQYGNQVNGSSGMRYDAIRVPWRIAIDSIWNNEPRAKQYLDMVMPYILSKGGVPSVQMYEIPSGKIIEWHNEMSVAMWAAGAFGSSQSDSVKQQFVDEIYTYWNSADASFNKQEYPDGKWRYFNQSLVLLGTSLIDGSFVSSGSTTGSNTNNSTPSDNDNTGSSTNGNSSENGSDTSSSSGNNSGELTTSTGTVFEKTGKMLKRKILVRVTQKQDTYTVRLFQIKNGKRKRFFKKSYSLPYAFKKISIKKKKIVLYHASNIQKTFTLSLRLQAR